jgi:hypothetical protein
LEYAKSEFLSGNSKKKQNAAVFAAVQQNSKPSLYKALRGFSRLVFEEHTQ